MILQLNILRFSHHHHRHHRRHHCHHCHHHRGMSEVHSAYLQAFRSLVSEYLNRALESLEVEPQFLSLTWIHQCFHMLPMIKNGFAKLMVEIDYPVGSWEAGSVDEYLDYTINMLHLLNSISSSISHVNQARVSLTHALSLMESYPSVAERMKEINKHDSIMEIKSTGDDQVDRKRNEKEWIFHEAMRVLRSSGYWVCGVVLSGLNSEVDPLIMNITGNMESIDTSLMALDCIFKKKLMEKGGNLKEVEEVNESVRSIVRSGVEYDCDGGMELKRRLEVIANGLKGLREEEQCVFKTLMTARNEVLEVLRRNHK